MKKHYLFFIAQNYSFEILRPLQKQIQKEGGNVLWFVYGHEVNLKLFTVREKFTTNVPEAINFAPIACFVPGNVIPSFFPGIKVQVFHGFEWKKKGHFVIRDCFDLYCTQGPFFTTKFKELAKQHRTFNVIETGWPKLDNLYKQGQLTDATNTKETTLLFAPTFSPKLTSAFDLLDEITRISKKQNWKWIIKFHPKMEQTCIEQYKQAENENLKVVDAASEVTTLLLNADVIVSDTSSIITEFMLLGKPAVTYKNSNPENELLNFTQASDLESMIIKALQPDQQKVEQIKNYSQQMHPYNDGMSSNRILDAVDEYIRGKKPLKKKPLNFFRNLKMRKKLNYWRI